MPIINKYPYTDFHEMNLDYLLGEVKKLRVMIDDHLAEYVREQLDNLFINAMYDEPTKTLILTLNQGGE